MSSRQPAQADDQDTPQRIVDAVAGASAEAVESLSDVANTAEGAVRRTNDSLHQSSDQTLALVGAFSVGTALGLLLGGSNRFLIAIALAPAALVAGVVMERLDRNDRMTRSTLH